MALTQQASAWYAEASKPGTSYVPYAGVIAVTTPVSKAYYSPSGQAGGGALTTYEFNEGMAYIGTELTTINESLGQASRSIVDSISDSISGTVSGLIDGVTNIGRTIADAFDGLLEIGRNIVNGIAGIVGDIVGGIRDALDWLGDKILSVIESSLSWIVDKLQWVGNRIYEGLAWIGNKLMEALSWLWEQIKTLWDWFMALVYEFIDWLANKWDDIADKTRIVVENALKSLGDALNAVWDVISGVISSIVTTIGGMIQQAIDNMRGSTSDMLEWLKSIWAWIQEQASKIGAILTMSDDEIISIIKDIITRVMTMILEMEFTLSQSVYSQMPGA